MPKAAKLKIESVAIDSLIEYPHNPRHGKVEAIAESLDAHGQFRPLVVQKSTRYVLAGNHTLAAAVELGWTQIQVVFLDVDDEQAKKIVLADNRTSDLAHYNEPSLAELLTSLDGDLVATGYDADDLDRLISNINAGLPEFEPEPEPTRLDVKTTVCCPECGHEF